LQSERRINTGINGISAELRRPDKIWSTAVSDRLKRTEVTLQIGESIRVGDAVISIIETQDNQAAVLVEELGFVDEFGTEAPLSASQPQ
jgi:hypothetical protein